MVYEYFQNLQRRTALDKVLHDNAFNIAKNSKMMDINADLPQWFLVI